MNKQELKQLIRESLEEELDEGFFDRIKARAKGNVSALGQLGKNISSVWHGDPTDMAPAAFKRGQEIAKSRVRKFLKKLSGVSTEFAADMESLFGENFSKAPVEIQKDLQGAEGAFDDFIEYVSAVEDKIANATPDMSKRRKARRGSAAKARRAPGKRGGK